MRTRIIRNEYGFMPQVRVLFLWCNWLNKEDSFTTLETAKKFIEYKQSLNEVVWDSSLDQQSQLA